MNLEQVFAFLKKKRDRALHLEVLNSVKLPMVWLRSSKNLELLCFVNGVLPTIGSRPILSNSDL